MATVKNYYLIFWIVGTILIAGSWFNLVPNWLGWVGFGVAGVAKEKQGKQPPSADAQDQPPGL